MKKNLVYIGLITGIILFPCFSFASTDFQIYCDYKIGGNYDCSGTIDTITDELKVLTLPFTRLDVVSPATDTPVLIDASWNFGDLYIAFMITIFIFYVIMKDILRFFFPDKIKIQRIKDAL